MMCASACIGVLVLSMDSTLGNSAEIVANKRRPSSRVYWATNGCPAANIGMATAVANFADTSNCKNIALLGLGLNSTNTSTMPHW